MRRLLILLAVYAAVALLSGCHDHDHYTVLEPPDEENAPDHEPSADHTQEGDRTSQED